MSQQNQQSIPAAEDPSVPEAKIVTSNGRVFYEREDGQVFSTGMFELNLIAGETNAQRVSIAQIAVRHEEFGLPGIFDPYNPAAGTPEGNALDEFTDAADDMDIAEAPHIPAAA